MDECRHKQQTCMKMSSAKKYFFSFFLSFFLKIRTVPCTAVNCWNKGFIYCTELVWCLLPAPWHVWGLRGPGRTSVHPSWPARWHPGWCRLSLCWLTPEPPPPLCPAGGVVSPRTAGPFLAACTSSTRCLSCLAFCFPGSLDTRPLLQFDNKPCVSLQC